MSNPRTLEQLQEQLDQKELELVMANECLSRFTHGISHEMNTPARTLNILLSMFDLEHAQQIDEEGAELLRMILASSRRIKDVTAGLMDYARHSQSITQFENVHTREIVLQVVQQLKTESDISDAQIHVGELPDVQATSDAIHTLFHHLINNALTFSPATTAPAEISISGQRTDDSVEYIVEDRGIGVDPKEAENIFTVFKRLHARSSYEGAGLGLPVCRQIVNSLDGRIWVTPGEPTGAAFHVQIPIDRS